MTSTINYYPASGWLTAATTWYIAAGVFVAVAAIVLLLTKEMPAPQRWTRILLIGACTAAAVVLMVQAQSTWTTPVFAPKTMLQNLWENYKTDYISSSTGQTFNDPHTGETTSEAEGYTMLRAAWMDDKPTFDASWQWTKSHLQRNDHLFSWLYGNQDNGAQGVIVAQNGNNSASDADTDIALALVFAYSRWQDPSYLQAAVPIMHGIWKNEVFYAGGQPYLGPDNLVSERAASSHDQLINPSYLSPYAYRIFSFLDRGDNWQGLIDSSYRILDKGIGSPLDVTTSAGLPPDWMQIDTATGALSAPSSATLATASQTTAFGYDALRTPWRIALDWTWYGDARDQQTLDAMGFLRDQWKQYGLLDAIYQHNGTPAAYYQSPAMYGGSMGYFLVADPNDATAVYDQKLQSLYNTDTETWKLPLDYYDANIAWFGMALYNNALPNLFALNLPSATSTSTSTSSSPLSP